ncbi:hypothetical protein CERSUDRAFT_151694 [Gelatoporia subvermispora B]|uniref:Sorting nexin MVP1 n=1 Tax=Ceriporiopsis subvermispora (strain B) TaxID=914234 RepID=M2QPH7_CERS8|nr:hypothetical protein CERSUDRAFT_151694 [Gelatoporia subvermispora B]
MFNAPRPVQPYGGSSVTNFGSSFVTENPLASSVYDDGLDPWSSTPSPAPPALPSFSTSSSSFSSVIADATVPPIYDQAFVAVDPTNSGETSVNALTRVLGTSSLSASIIDKIVSLVSSRPRVSKLEFFVALALAALAQSGKDISIERVALMAQQNSLPEPNLDLATLAPTSGFTPYSSGGAAARSPVQRAYSTEDPWSTTRYPAATGTTNGAGSLNNGAPSSISGTGLPKDWWKKQENVYVNILGQQGFILNRYLVYEIATDRGTPVPRRYSEFVFLWDCLVKRYPFRLLPSLPPKRVGRDENFIEQRRRGLARFLNFVINHPIIKDDSVLSAFLAEPSLEAWRKHTAISLDEESVSKRVDRVEEMTIPSDLEEKLAMVRQKIGFLIEHWQKICMLAERVIRRREAAAVWVPLLKRSSLRAHLPLPSLSPASSTSSGPDSDADEISSSIFGSLRTGVSGRDQADLARLTNTMKSLVEVNERCWRGDDCELCAGVRQGLGQVSVHTQKHSDQMEHRSRTMLYNTLEALKSQRDLYIAMRDLFIRHDRLSVDQVDRLKKRVDTNSQKLESVKQAKKEGWEQEADKITGLIEKDQASINAQMNRRIFIRACMWHELRVVLHNRENTLLTQTVRTFAREEHEFSEGVVTNWASLVDAVDGMPYE